MRQALSLSSRAKSPSRPHPRLLPATPARSYFWFLPRLAGEGVGKSSVTREGVEGREPFLLPRPLGEGRGEGAESARRHPFPSLFPRGGGRRGRGAWPRPRCRMPSSAAPDGSLVGRPGACSERSRRTCPESCRRDARPTRKDSQPLSMTEKARFFLHSERRSPFFCHCERRPPESKNPGFAVILNPSASLGVCDFFDVSVWCNPERALRESKDRGKTRGLSTLAAPAFAQDDTRLGGTQKTHKL